MKNANVLELSFIAKLHGRNETLGGGLSLYLGVSLGVKFAHAETILNWVFVENVELSAAARTQ